MDSTILKQSLEETDNLLNKLKEIPEQDKIDKNNDIKKMIEYFNNMTDSIEERRNKVYESSITIVAIIVAAATIMFMNLEWIKYIAIPITFLSILLISLLILICVFYKQNQSNYIFKDKEISKYTNKWKWFYYGNEHITKISIKDNNDVDHYINGLNLLIGKYTEEKIDSELQNNLQQLYVLQVHNYYKNQFYKQLVKVQRIGLLISLMGAVICAIVVLCIK